MDWFRESFGTDYLTLYPHRGDDEARAAAGFLRRTALGEAGGRLLDLACGEGRYGRALGRVGVRCVGLDLSPDMLAEAAHRGGAGARLVRGDMRTLPFRCGSFQGAILMFTSFGYFADEADDLRVAQEVCRCLAPGGRFVLDLPNPADVRARLRPRDDYRQADERVRVERRLEGDRVEKSIEIRPVVGPPRTYRESVRLYDLKRAVALLARAGLEAVSFHGEVGPDPFAEGSARLVIVARRAT